MIAVYSPYTSARLTYTLNLFFTQWLNVDVEVYTDQEAFERHSTPCKLWYSDVEGPNNIPWIYNHGFLELTEGRKCKVKLKGEGEEVQIFPGGGIMSFDVFAAVFFCVSRYEEYGDQTLDSHGRFPATNSLAYRMGFLEIPVVDIWQKQLVNKLSNHWQTNPFTNPKYKCVLTVDVDNASAYAFKGVLRSMLGIARALLRFDKTLRPRIKTLASSRRDPFFTYHSQWALARRHNISLIHFVLCAGLSPHDRSLHPKNPNFQQLIRGMDEQANVGWHPSYSAFGHFSVLEKEQRQLAAILKKPLRISRQHYIRLRFPETYRQLLALAITDDYSMGYPDKDGFRAGTSMPFTFFDVEKNCDTKLMIHPFYFLDTYFSERQCLTADQALPKMKRYVDLVSTHGGELNLVWHHRTFSELMPQWKGWTRVLDNLLHYATKK